MLNKYKEALECAKQHARRKYPHRACGLILNGEYRAVKNIAIDTKKDFLFPRGLIESIARRNINMLFVSQTHEPYYPEKPELGFQDKHDLPLAFLALNHLSTSQPIIWGADAPIEPILGRTFVNGVTDCWSVVRDCYRLGKDALARQGIDGWPYDPISLPSMPRNDGWWDCGEDYYRENFQKLGFKEITAQEARIGDGFLTKIKSDKLNHAGILVNNGDIIHHLPARLSRREPAGLWGRGADMWLRYVGTA